MIWLIALYDDYNDDDDHDDDETGDEANYGGEENTARMTMMIMITIPIFCG